MNCLTKLFQQKRRRIGYILAFSGPMISKRDSSDMQYYISILPCLEIVIVIFMVFVVLLNETVTIVLRVS